VTRIGDARITACLYTLIIKSCNLFYLFLYIQIGVLCRALFLLVLPQITSAVRGIAEVQATSLKLARSCLGLPQKNRAILTGRRLRQFPVLADGFYFVLRSSQAKSIFVLQACVIDGERGTFIVDMKNMMFVSVCTGLF
jgi:hypothetical protein